MPQSYFDFNFSVPFGVITFRRQSVDPPDWNRLTNHLSDFVVQSSGTIEDDGFGMLEVDFANKYIGGGVLSKGCVQVGLFLEVCDFTTVKFGTFSSVLFPGQSEITSLNLLEEVKRFSCGRVLKETIVYYFGNSKFLRKKFVS